MRNRELVNCYYILPKMSFIWCHTCLWLGITCWRPRGPIQCWIIIWIYRIKLSFSRCSGMLIIVYYIIVFFSRYLVFLFRNILTSVVLASTWLGILNVFMPLTLYKKPYILDKDLVFGFGKKIYNNLDLTMNDSHSTPPYWQGFIWTKSLYQNKQVMKI